MGERDDAGEAADRRLATQADGYEKSAPRPDQIAAFGAALS